MAHTSASSSGDMKMRLAEFVKKDSLWEWRGFVGRSVEGETEEYGLEGY